MQQVNHYKKFQDRNWSVTVTDQSDRMSQARPTISIDCLTGIACLTVIIMNITLFGGQFLRVML